MQTLALDFSDNDTEAGFRLHTLEILNWGTFNNKVWRIEPESHNSLLTGDIGSGKSTLVDAITTLLVPHHRIVYNKAAGAESKERSLYSYIRGEYKNKKDELTQSSASIALRDHNSYSVLLATFRNAGYDQEITLAQVFWIKDNNRNPERFFVIATNKLNIQTNFSGFGKDISTLKRQLKHNNHVEIFENFKEYSAKFRHLFGIHNEQALELFYQTVSMKSVGNLTEFVRLHMLEKTHSQHRIDELRNNFENLNRAHEAVLKAQAQIALLTPLIGLCDEYQLINNQCKTQRECRENLTTYFAKHKLNLLEIKKNELLEKLDSLTHKHQITKTTLEKFRDQELSVMQSMANQGGNRLQEIAREIDNLLKIRETKKQAATNYNQLLQKLELTAVKNADDFVTTIQHLNQLFQEIEKVIENYQLTQIDNKIEIKKIENEQKELQGELDSLRKNKNNIPVRMLELRAELSKILEIHENELPFAGELIQVDANASQWEGAIERVLHNFGLSLLVPAQYYQQVSHYVERTHLKGRLVYFCIKDEDYKIKQEVHPQALINKLQIKPASDFYAWLKYSIVNQFNYVCCETLEEFRHLPKAITHSGQIKSSSQKHEKDDRHSLQDRSRYILGWDNAEKIIAIETKINTNAVIGKNLADKFVENQKLQQQTIVKRDHCRDVLNIKSFMEIDWKPFTLSIDALQKEKQQIEADFDILKALQQQLLSIQTDIKNQTLKLEAVADQRSRCNQQLEDTQLIIADLDALAKHVIEAEILALIDAERAMAILDKDLNLQNIDKFQTQIRENIQHKIDAQDRKLKTLAQNIIQRMQHYKQEYPTDTVEIDINIESAKEFSRILNQLLAEDLPRHHEKFKQLLNEGTINSIALFQNQLNKEKQDIEEKIKMINVSLNEIEYNSGTKIQLIIDRTQDLEIREFQQELRDCLSDTLDKDSLYNETKFLQVKKLIDRFGGRVGYADLDARWTKKVSDVRNWFNFSASERWLEDNTEKEFYSDSSGKSGGQKEKLAYTILASALAYQFGLEWGVRQSRSFRFVVIDEAFGKGSDESTRYALELFKKLNLQLLIVTPLQKIHIIEDYIKAVHFVHNEAGCNSMIRNLTIEDYHKNKEKFSKTTIAHDYV